MEKSPYLLFNNHPSVIFLAALAVILAAFFFGVGLDAHSLPFPPEAEFSDAVTSHWPNAHFLRESVLEEHSWPLWRPLHMSGQPFAANPLNKVWYPPQWLVLVLPPIVHLNGLTWLHLVIGGAGAWWWGRATGLSSISAALVGFGYAFAPRLIASAGAGHLDLVYAAAWFPWLLWASYQLVDERPAAAWYLAAFATLCFLADVRFCAYAFVTTAGYVLWLIAQQPAAQPRKAPGLLGLRLVYAGLLTLGLTAFQWMPLLLYRATLSRSTITLDDAAIHSLHAGQWLGLLIGDHGGAWETLVYVGVSTLTLAVTALILRPRRFAFWGIWLVLLMGYAMGDQFILWPVLNRLLPFLRWWRVPPRVWLVAALIVPYLAGWGAQILVASPPDRKIARLSTAALLGGGLMCGVFSTLTLNSALDLSALLGLFFLPLTALVILLVMLRRVSPHTALLLFTVIVMSDVMWMDQTVIEGRHRDEWLEPHRELAEYLRDSDVQRVYSPSYSVPQHAAAYWEIPQFGGVDPFQLADYVAVAEAATGVQADGYSITIPAFETDEDTNFDSQREALAGANSEAGIQPDKLGQWLVTHVVATFEIDAPGLVRVAQFDNIIVYRNIFAPAVSLVWHGPNRVTVHAEEPVPETLYAVANGRWRDAPDQVPGLPGPVDSSTRTWTYEYDRSEIWYSAVMAGLLIVLAMSVWWRAIRARSGNRH